MVIGVGLGVGNISASNCIECGNAESLELHGGFMLNPTLALVADIWSTGHSEASSKARQTLFTVATQYWATDRLWLKVGMGSSSFENSPQVVLGNLDSTQPAENGLGLTGAGGIEALQHGKFALDLQARFGRGFYDRGGKVDTVAFVVAACWR